MGLVFKWIVIGLVITVFGAYLINLGVMLKKSYSIGSWACVGLESSRGCNLPQFLLDGFGMLFIGMIFSLGLFPFLPAIIIFFIGFLWEKRRLPSIDFKI